MDTLAEAFGGVVPDRVLAQVGELWDLLDVLDGEEDAEEAEAE